MDGRLGGEAGAVVARRGHPETPILLRDRLPFSWDERDGIEGFLTGPPMVGESRMREGLWALLSSCAHALIPLFTPLGCNSTGCTVSSYGQ